MAATSGLRDPDDFKEFVASGTGESRFTLLYTGSLYGGHRNPEFFFTAVRRWLDRKPEIAPQLRLLFIGNWAPESGTGGGLIIKRSGEQFAISQFPREPKSRDRLPDRQPFFDIFAVRERGHACMREKFALEMVAEAHRKVEEGHVRGKIALKVADEQAFRNQ